MSQKITTQACQFLTKLAESLDIPETRETEARDRYKSVGRWLSRDQSMLAPYNPEVYTQGSFRLGTVIKPLSGDDEYDIDLVCSLGLGKTQCTQKALKDALGTELQGYVKANGIKQPAKEGRRCWTLNYSNDAQFHLDILPALPDGDDFLALLKNHHQAPNEWAAYALAITDNTTRNYAVIDTEWPRSNPKGYAEWFRDRMKVQYQRKRALLAESISANVEEVPEYKIKTPLQRAVQILKRHRDLMFADDQDDKPISVIITTLAGHAYNEEGDLEEALVNIVDGMPRYIEQRDGIAWVPNPVNPLENFADKWGEHPQRARNFELWLGQAKEDLGQISQLANLHEAEHFLKAKFGDRAVSEALGAFPKSLLQRAIDIIPGGRQLQQLFSASHRQTPQWPEVDSGKACLNATYNSAGFRPRPVISNGKPLPKNVELRFRVETNIASPYKVYWQVVNTGDEATRSSCLRGGFYDGLASKGGRVREEKTLYSGSHWVECFIVKKGQCVARTGEFIVNIQ